MNDIQVDPEVLRQARYEELQKYREQVKDSEDKWQDVSSTTLDAPATHTVRLLDPCLWPITCVIEMNNALSSHSHFYL